MRRIIAKIVETNFNDHIIQVVGRDINDQLETIDPFKKFKYFEPRMYSVGDIFEITNYTIDHFNDQIKGNACSHFVNPYSEEIIYSL